MAGVSAPLQNVQCARNELRDKVTLVGERIEYDFTTAGHVDGFDFRTGDGGCARFVLEVGDYQVFVGRERRTPAGYDFVLCP